MAEVESDTLVLHAEWLASLVKLDTKMEAVLGRLDKINGAVQRHELDLTHIKTGQAAQTSTCLAAGLTRTDLMGRLKKVEDSFLRGSGALTLFRDCLAIAALCATAWKAFHG